LAAFKVFLLAQAGIEGTGREEGGDEK